ncbi:MAG TPA: hypothetical protein VFQ61_10000 [Polyangiaceae bacterium]|nr:hypothetical protein [Polyangiaceae bacterium]
MAVPAAMRGQLVDEVGLGSSVSTSLVVDHEPERRTSTAWMFEAGTDSGVFLPSLALGAGPLLRLGSGKAAPGARLQVALSFKLLSLGSSVDIHPGAKEELASFLWGQLSL